MLLHAFISFLVVRGVVPGRRIEIPADVVPNRFAVLVRGRHGNEIQSGPRTLHIEAHHNLFVGADFDLGVSEAADAQNTLVHHVFIEGSAARRRGDREVVVRAKHEPEARNKHRIVAEIRKRDAGLCVHGVRGAVHE